MNIMIYIYTVTAVSIAIPIVFYLFSPKAQRSEAGNRQFLQQEIKAMPAEQGAVLLYATPGKALFRAAIHMICMMMPIIQISFLKYSYRLTNLNVAEKKQSIDYASFACVVAPVLFLIYSLYLFRKGLKTWQSEYRPSLDSAMVVDTIAFKAPVHKKRKRRKRTGTRKRKRTGTRNEKKDRHEKRKRTGTKKKDRHRRGAREEEKKDRHLNRATGSNN